MNINTIWLPIVGLILSAVTIFAIYYGPISALKVQRKLDEEREARTRKLYIFKTLMSYRATRMSPLYVQALNLIDVEFTENNEEERAVRNTWKELVDLYSNFKTTQNAVEKADDLNAALLAAMGKSLGYDFDTVHLKKGAYYPEYLGNVELEQHSLRRMVLELLDGGGKRKLPIAMFEQKFPDLIDQPQEKPVDSGWEKET
jgi:Family of unknown function (DUF6680)